MVLACQKDSYLREFKSKVISCKTGFLQVINGNDATTHTTGFEVICEDSVLFPEGGGQPSDKGTLNDTISVLHTIRRGNDVVFFTDKAVEVGTEVVQKINWRRRLDHMQQHSGQHLVSGVADKRWGLKTSSWWLGEKTSFIEFDSPQIAPEVYCGLETVVNERIMEALPVDVSVFQLGDPALSEATTRGLPKNHEGDIRVVTIKNLDCNMCCGTHVTNLSQLQAIKFLFMEKGKKDKTNIHFIAGGRVLLHFGTLLEREKQLSTLLKNHPSDHADLVEKTQLSLKGALKNVQTLLKDVATLEAQKFKRIDPRPPYVCIFKKEGDADFAKTFIKSIGDDKVLKLVMWGDEKGEGQFQMHGPSEHISLLGPQVCEELKGKGMGKGSNYSAKVTALGKKNKAEAIVKQHFKDK